MELTQAMSNALKQVTTRHEWFFHLTATNRVTGEVEKVYLWTGKDEYRITMNGEFRIYHGAGGLISFDRLTYASGLNIQSQSISLAISDPNVTQLVRLYEPKMGKAEITLGLFDEDTNMIGYAIAFDGMIDSIDITGNMQEATCAVKLVSSMRMGTNKLAKTQSDAEQRKRDPNDRGREYSSLDETKVAWGSRKLPTTDWRPSRK